MLESIIAVISSVPWYWVLLAVLGVTILENVFPPAPCDSVIIFTGTLVGIGSINLIPLLIISTIGSTIGFAVMFFLGQFIGHKVIKSSKFPFINEKAIKRPKAWIDKYGYYVIASNRFLSGTRGVISFIAGMAEMSPVRTITLAGVSAMLWNFLLIYLGMELGKNWRLAEGYIEYDWKYILPIAVIVIILVFITKSLFKFLKKK